MRRLSGWRLALRVARRDALRARGRSILVLVMIALPVLGVTAADVVMQTSDVSGTEALDRRLGAADARVSLQPGITRSMQGVDPDVLSSGDGPGRSMRTADLADVRRALGRDVHGTSWRRGMVLVETDHGVSDVESAQLDLADPLAEGIFEVASGRVPRADDEVVVNTALADRGFTLGEQLQLVDGPALTVVGIGESTSYRDRSMLVGTSDVLWTADQGERTAWLIDGGPVSWDQVRAINRIGGLVLSRAVLVDPPPESEIPARVRSESSGSDDALVAVAVLIVVMALIEVVLLAGPAFAVGARRQSRSLALMAATGGTPAQSRRVVLAGGVVLGGVGALLGVVLGIAAAWALLPAAQRFSNSWFGPFDVPWPHLAGIAGFGLLSALLAAVVPAWIASHQDVVSVLAGRRGDKAPGLRSPLIGIVLLGAGVAGAAFGALRPSSGEFFIAAAAIVSVLGMILLVPLVLAGLARVSSRLPLTVRYAVRDAARHRTRTVPAVAAVAATVAGVVALGIANASDAAQNEANYTPALALGQASISGYGLDASGWTRLKVAAEHTIPGARVVPRRGLVDGMPPSLPGARSYYLDFRAVGDRDPLLVMYSTALGSAVLVDDALPTAIQGIAEADRARAADMLARGGAVVFTDRTVDADEVRIRGERQSTGRSRPLTPVTVPAVFVPVPSGHAMAEAVLPNTVVRELGAESATVALGISGAEISERQEADLSEAIAAVTTDAGLYVERGYRNSDETAILLLILGVLGGILMLGGTLTATFLALSDARPDLATLSAVGASPRTRRGVAAAYAMVVGLVGAALGAVVGFVPGIAITYPLTVVSGETDASQVTGPFLDVPWLLIGSLVIVLPLLTALVVGLTARSRLPLGARLD